jgi:hypothetical protein
VCEILDPNEELNSAQFFDIYVEKIEVKKHQKFFLNKKSKKKTGKVFTIR